MTINERVSDERLNIIKSWRKTYGQDANVMIPASEAEAIARELKQYRAAVGPTEQRDELPYDPQIAEYEKIMQQAIPDGYALVPAEPTAEMQSAAASAIRFETTPINKLWTGNAVYKAMVAAAPQQEAESE